VSLVVRNLSARYGQAGVLWNIDLNVGEGQVVGILGRNGAGKTTLLRCLAGLHERKTGDIEFKSSPIGQLAAHQIAKKGMAFVREGARLPSTLTVRQILELGVRLAEIKGVSAPNLSVVWKWFPILEPLVQRKAGLLSGGQRQALALAAALLSAPSLILLDEPSAGLAPQVASDLFKSIGRLIGEGMSALIVEQSPMWLEEIASKAYLLEVGRVTADGPVQTLVQKRERQLF
jgi:branched-chain amino acid transport system ATP-binding protein